METRFIDGGEYVDRQSYIRIRDELSKLRETSSWISVEDYMPDEATPVLVRGVTNGEPYVSVSMVTWEEADEEAGWCWNQLDMPYMPDLHDASNYIFDDDYTFTHWQPLPSAELGE